MMNGNLFIIAAPSGGGKSSLVAALLERDPALSLSISYTTRAPRPGEVNGREYHFVTLEAFHRMREAGEFLECAEVYGNWYGTSQNWIASTMAAGRDVLLEIDWQGAQQVRRLFPAAVSIFVLPPSLQALKQRLKGRNTDSPEVIARRLAAMAEDVSHLAEFDYVIINNQFDEAAQDLQSIVRAQRLHGDAQIARHHKLINQLVKR